MRSAQNQTTPATSKKVKLSFPLSLLMPFSLSLFMLINHEFCLENAFNRLFLFVETDISEAILLKHLQVHQQSPSGIRQAFGHKSLSCKI